MAHHLTKRIPLIIHHHNEIFFQKDELDNIGNRFKGIRMSGYNSITTSFPIHNSFEEAN